MQWVLENWLWILFGGGMVAMHLFGHGGHGKTGDASLPPQDTGPLPPDKDHPEDRS